MRQLARWLAVPAAVGMFLVLVMGATVTNTGSAEGCGRSWPLCNGRFIPEQATATLIEFSHRAVTGIEGLLVAALAVAAWIGWRERATLRWLIGLMVVTLLLQAGMGAWAVLYPQTPAVLATHFGISLLCFASTCLVASAILRDAAAAPAPIDRRFRSAAWAVGAFCLVVVYLGAFVRHTNSQLACIDWPLCNGQVVPDLLGPAGIVFWHRLGAATLLVALIGLAQLASRPDLRRASLAAVAFGLLQALSGAVVVFTRMDLFSALSHAALMALLFAALSYVCFETLSGGRRVRVVGPPVAPQGDRRELLQVFGSNAVEPIDQPVRNGVVVVEGKAGPRQ